MPIDYSSFTNNGPTTTTALGKWWTEDSIDAPAALFGVVKYLQQNQSLRTTQLLTSTRLYGNMSLMGMNGLTYSKLASVTNKNTGRITYNVCQSAVDTLTAKLAKNKPKPLFLTSGGDYKLQRKAEKLTKFVEGILYENKGHDLGIQIFRDASIWGTGAVHVFEEHDRIKLERCIITEIVVDEVEAFYGKPRSLYRVKNVDRSVLKSMFAEQIKADPSIGDAIDNANQARPDDLGGYPTVSDEISICEAFHLPSGPDEEDGLHIICLEKKELFREQYDRHYFPFVFFHFSKKLFGFWGQGGVEQIQNIQLEINKLLWVIQRSMHLGGSFKILLENGSKIVKEHLNSDIGAIVNYTGVKPEYVTPPMVQPETYAHLTTLKNAAYEQFGISQLSAAAQKPQGLNSGKALREYNDIESDRFMTLGQAYEQFFVDVSELIVSTAKHNFKGRSYKVNVPAKSFIETIDWQDVHMQKDEYVLKCYPVSALPNEPAGRLETVQELMQAGLIDPEAGRRLLDYPDLEEEEGLANAPQDYLHEILDKMVDEGVYTAPEPYDDLQRARKLCLLYYAKYKCAGLEEEKLELFRRFLGQLDLLTAAANPPMPQAQPGAQVQPQAAPQPQPQSELVPNQPGVPQ